MIPVMPVPTSLDITVLPAGGVGRLFFCPERQPEKTEFLLFLQTIRKSDAKKRCPEENEKEYGESQEAKNIM